MNTSALVSSKISNLGGLERLVIFLLKGAKVWWKEIKLLRLYATEYLALKYSPWPNAMDVA